MTSWRVPEYAAKLQLTAQQYSALLGRMYSMQIQRKTYRHQVSGMLQINSFTEAANGELNAYALVWISSAKSIIPINQILTFKLIDVCEPGWTDEEINAVSQNLPVIIKGVLNKFGEVSPEFGLFISDFLKKEATNS